MQYIIAALWTASGLKDWNMEMKRQTEHWMLVRSMLVLVYAEWMNVCNVVLFEYRFWLPAWPKFMH